MYGYFQSNSSYSNVINFQQWSEAGWNGVACVNLDSHPFPVLALKFKDIGIGKMIFKQWKYYFGEDDEQDSIRISVIREIDKNNPLHFVFHITQRDNTFDVDEYHRNFLGLNSRAALVQPDSTDTLESFINNCEGKEYALAPEPETSDESIPMMGYAIRKRTFHVTDAWRINHKHEDAWAIANPENVIVPKGVAHPRINRLIDVRQRFLKRFRERLGGGN